jgi:hypothetical protein
LIIISAAHAAHSHLPYATCSWNYEQTVCTPALHLLLKTACVLGCAVVSWVPHPALLLLLLLT